MSAEIFAWLDSEIEHERVSIRAREEEAATWRDPDETKWRTASVLWPITRGGRLPNAEKRAGYARTADLIREIHEKRLRHFEAIRDLLAAGVP